MYKISLMYKNVFNLPLHKNCSASCVHVLTCLIFSIMKEGPFDIQGGYSPNGRFLVQETFPKTLPRFVLILIYRSTERQRNQAFCVTAADWSTITLHDSPSNQRWFNYHNQHESAVLIGLFHAASLVLPPVESYRNFRKPSQRGVQGYLSSLQQRVGGGGCWDF